MNLRSSTCDVAAGPKHLNQTYKAVFTGTYSYKFDFIDQLDESIHSFTTVSSSLFLLWNVPGLQYGHSYDVEITAVYSLTNSIGQTEIIFADPGLVCSQAIEIVYSQTIPVSFNCENHGPISPNKWISFGPFVSGASGHELEFTNTNGLEAPIYKTLGTTRLFRLRDIVGLIGGNSYNVRCKPIFANGYSVNWGPATCLSMASLSNFFTIANNFESEIQVAELPTEMQPTFTGRVFPNPNEGKQINLAFVTNEAKQIDVEVYDLMGKLVHKEIIYLTSDTNVEINPKMELATGLYHVYLTSGDEKYIEKLIVTKP
jgi:hypothetical protein